MSDPPISSVNPQRKISVVLHRISNVIRLASEKKSTKHRGMDFTVEK